MKVRLVNIVATPPHHLLRIIIVLSILFLISMPFILSSGIIATAHFQFPRTTTKHRTTTSTSSTSSTVVASQACTITSTSISAQCIAKLHGTRIAVVNPIFTSTAYGFGTPNSNSFYEFYGKNVKTKMGQYIKSGLSLLDLNVSSQWGYSYGLYVFVHDLESKNTLSAANTHIITDIDVNNGGLFLSNGSRRYDAAIVGFSEYVAEQEFSSYRNFVNTGGKLILIDACNFLAEVNYDPGTNRLSLVSGHGWSFNGTDAWVGPYNFWNVSATGWVGSIYGHFYTEGYTIQGASANTSNPASQVIRAVYGQSFLSSAYSGHEENYLTNSSDSVIGYWRVHNFKSHDVIAIYSHDYGAGFVVHTGIFATDILSSNKQMQFLILVSILTSF